MAREMEFAIPQELKRAEASRWRGSSSSASS